MIACHAAELASEILLLPKCLDIDEVVAPPIAPADIICITVKNGKTNAKLANSIFPNLDIKKASVKIIIGIEETPKKLGKESLHTILTTEPFNIISMLFFISSVVSLYYKDRGGQSPSDFKISKALKVFSIPSFTLIDGYSPT